jgi:hypothetical protein
MRMSMKEFRVSWLGLCLLTSALLGCAGKVETETVSGKISYKGTALPGGSITLVASDGKTFGGEISESGEFSIADVPTGSCKVMVDNANLKMLEKMQEKGGIPPGAPRDAKIPEGMPTMKGHYIPIPDKFKRVETSNVNLTVTKGQQSYPVDLK